MLLNNCKKEDKTPKNPTNGKTTAVFNSGITYGTLTDQDGNDYKTVTIGTQIWMAENLLTTKYNDGTSIANVTGTNEWENLTTDAYCNYNNTTTSDSIATFGRLYNWYAVKTGKLAPKGWHVPTDAEWTTLTTYLGGESVSGGKLKETGTTHWTTPNTGATNETGFTALPDGYRNGLGTYSNIGRSGYWWSSTENSSIAAWSSSMYYNDIDVYRSIYNKRYGFSVRCIRDQ